MNETVDGEYQNFKSKGGAYTREKFLEKQKILKKWSITSVTRKLKF